MDERPCGCRFKVFTLEPLALSVKAGCRDGRAVSMDSEAMARHLGILPDPAGATDPAGAEEDADTSHPEPSVEPTPITALNALPVAPAGTYRDGPAGEGPLALGQHILVLTSDGQWWRAAVDSPDYSFTPGTLDIPQGRLGSLVDEASGEEFAACLTDAESGEEALPLADVLTLAVAVA
jgi:hypothetical protein